MSSRILTSHFSGLEEFLQQHAALLAKSTDGTVAVFANNAPAFYALTPARLAQLLELEARLARPGSDIALDPQFFEEPAAAPLRCRWANLPCTPTGSRTPIFSAWPRCGALP
jgi:hypothetical protein